MREDDFSDRLNQRANFSGFTPLHYAALSDSHECVRRLIDAGILLIIIISSKFLAQDNDFPAFCLVP